MYRIDILGTALNTVLVGCAGFYYGLAHDYFIMGIPNDKSMTEGFPTTAGKAIGVSYLVLSILRTALLVAEDANILTGKNLKIIGTALFATWGVASIVAFRQLNLIAGLGTIILSSWLALKSIQLLNA